MSLNLPTPQKRRPPGFRAKHGGVLRFLALCAVLSLVVGACSGTDDATDDGDTDGTTAATEEQVDAPATTGDAPATTGEPEAEGDPIHVNAAVPALGNGQWAPWLTGHDNRAAAMFVYETLTWANPDTFEHEGLLAESFEVSDDGLTWTFKLRPDIPFHDDWGTVTAEDVRFSWEAWAFREDSTHTLGALYSDAVGGDMDNFEIINDLEFSVTAETPVTVLPAALADNQQGLQITSKAYFDEMGEEAEDHPIGTAALEFVSQTVGDRLELEGVKDHWKTPTQFDTLTLHEIPDDAAALAQVQTGDLDIALLSGTLVGEAQSADVEIQTAPSTTNLFLVLGGYYVDRPSFDADSPWIQADNPDQGLAVREAMSLAIDRELLLNQLLNGFGEPAHGPLVQTPANPELVDSSWDLPAYDPDLARQRLADGGYPDGFPVTIFSYDDYVDLPTISQAIAAMWEEIGLDVTFEHGEEEILEQRLIDEETDGITHLKLNGLKGEATTQLNTYRNNVAEKRIVHPALDGGYNAASAEPDYEARQAIMRDMITQLRDEYALISLLALDLPFAVSDRFESWTPIAGLDDLSGIATIRVSEE